ncbi:MAG: 30S ribosomal protein S2 [Planctomycetota bacterium]|jgi:small subunit ribosomal protein S2|nr:30S ribosomal protein S2 [Planctomycetota bacterium]
MAIVTIKELIEAGVHFGTKSSLWHPKMKPFIFGKRGGIHIIDARETAKALINAHYFIQKLARQNKQVLFVGTKRQAKDVVRDAARSIGMPFICERWLGGTLTNNSTIRASIRRLDDIENEMARPDYQRASKKAQARYARERRRILRNLEGVRTMTKLPDALFVVDPSKEQTAVREAHRLGIPVIALTDTDCNPDQVNLPIPGNDDGIRSIQTVVKVLVEAIKSGRALQTQKADEKKASEEAKPAAPEAKADAPAAAAPEAAPEAKADAPAAAAPEAKPEAATEA